MALSLRFGAAMAAVLLVACGPEAGHPHAAGPAPTGESDSGPPPPPPPEEDSGPPPLDCSEPTNEGCPCEGAGDEVFCGYVSRHSESYTACSPGTAVCGEDLTWGPCIGDQIAPPVK